MYSNGCEISGADKYLINNFVRAQADGMTYLMLTLCKSFLIQNVVRVLSDVAAHRLRIFWLSVSGEK